MRVKPVVALYTYNNQISFLIMKLRFGVQYKKRTRKKNE